MTTAFSKNDLVKRWRFALIALVTFVILGAIGLAVDVRQHGGYSGYGRQQTSQYYGLLNTSPLQRYTDVLGIGHNSGASIGTMKRALDYGADVIEIDVAQRNGRLIAAHDSPVGWRSRVFRGLSLEQSWSFASSASMIQLDLKERSPAFLEKVFVFLEQHADDQTVMISTSDIETLSRFEERMPDVLRFLSLGNAIHLDRFLTDSAVISLVDGVSVRHTMLTPELVQQLEEMEVVIIAWTVNDLARVNDLVDMGVDGVSTDNLAIIELIHRLGRLLG